MYLDELKARYGDVEQFLEYVRAQMRLHDISKRRLAGEMLVARRDLQRWLSGEVTPRLESLLRLDEALKRLLK